MHYSELKLYLSGAYDSTFFLSAGPKKNKYICFMPRDTYAHAYLT